MAKLRVIIGQGTATEVYRYTAASKDWETIVIGPRGLWSVLPGEHKMGQPAHLLSLPGQNVPAYQSASGKTAKGMANFLDVHSYQQGLLELAKANDKRSGLVTLTQGKKGQTINLAACKVESVEREFNRTTLLVTTANPRLTLRVDQVVIGTGIGPQRTPEGADIKIVGKPDPSVGFKQILEAAEYFAAAPPYGKEVMIFGGGATAAWVAAEAMERATRLKWIARKSSRGNSDPFAGGTLPGDRNFQVISLTTPLRAIANVTEIKYLPAAYAGKRRLRGPKLRVTVQAEGKPPQVCVVDQFVYSLGGDQFAEGSIRRMVAPDLIRALEPVRDKSQALSDGKGTLALATPGRELLVIGAAVYNFETYAMPRQPAPMSTLPRNAQVLDGIAMVVASVSALNNYIPIKQDAKANVVECSINFNTADKNQLSCYVAAFYPELAADKANAIVDEVVLQRSDKAPGREFGVTEAEFNEIVHRHAA
jgi:hypothetical protein